MLAAWIASIALLAVPPDDRMTCATLKHVVMSATHGFGPLDPRQLFAGADRWATDVQLGYGDMTCVVKMGGDPRSYECVALQESHVGGDDAKILAAFAGKCLGVAMKADQASGDVTASVRGVEIRISHDQIIRHGPQGTLSNHLALRVTAPRD